MTKLIKKYIVITNNNREPLSKYCEENGILTCSQRTVRHMLADFSDILAVGFDSRGEAGYARGDIKVYTDADYEEVTMKELQPKVMTTKGDGLLDIKKKFIILTNANHKFITQYCESMGLRTKAGTRNPSDLFNMGVKFMGFSEDDHLVYSSRGIQTFLNQGYEEIDSCDLKLHKEPLPHEMGVVEDEPEVVEVVDTETKPQPSKRDMVIKLNEMYTTRDSLDLAIEQTEQLLKNVL